MIAAWLANLHNVKTPTRNSRVQETHVTHEVSKGTLDLSLRRPKQKNERFKNQNTTNTNAHGIENTRRSGTSWAHWKTQNLHHELARLCWRHEFQITFILSLLHFPTWFNDSRSDSCHLGLLPFFEGTRRASMAVATVNSVRAASRFPEPSTRLALPCAMQCWTLWRSLRWTLWGCFQTLLWHEALPWQTNLQGSKLVRRFVGIVRLIPSPRWHVRSHVAILLQVHSAKGNELPSIDVQTGPSHFLWSHSHIGRIGHVGRMCRMCRIALLWDGWGWVAYQSTAACSWNVAMEWLASNSAGLRRPRLRLGPQGAAPCDAGHPPKPHLTGERQMEKSWGREQPTNS